MMSPFLHRLWGKVEPGLLNYLRLMGNGWVSRKTIVIVEFQGSLGDLVCLFASLPGLRARHAPCQLILITHREYLGLVRSTSLVDIAALRYGLLHLFARRFCRRQNYYTPDFVLDASKGTEVNPPIHTAVHFAQILGVTSRLDEVHLRPPISLQRKMARHLARINPEAWPIVAVHTGPTWPVRQWPYWSELGARLQRELRGCVVQIGNDANSTAPQGHPPSRIPFAVDLVNRLSVLETMALLAQAHLFIGIDSGPLHLATTLGTPTVGLFGPVLGQLRAHPRAPFICLTANVPCLGCHHDPAGPLHWRTGCPYDIRCMRELSVDTVFSAIQQSLRRSTSP